MTAAAFADQLNAASRDARTRTSLRIAVMHEPDCPAVDHVLETALPTRRRAPTYTAPVAMTRTLAKSPAPYTRGRSW